MSHAGPGTEKELPDYLQQVSNLFYLLSGVLFIGGLYMDWQRPGEAIIPMFAYADEPTANSGLFILAIIILAVGYLVSRTGLYIEELRTEKIDQTQEWTVEVGEMGDS